MDINKPEAPKPQGVSTGVKAVLLILAIALLGFMAYMVWFTQDDLDVGGGVTISKKKTATTTAKTTATATAVAKSCDFDTAKSKVTLRAAKTYDLMEEAFDTLVCGYLSTKEQTSLGGDKKVTGAYIAVKSFYDSKFKDSVNKVINEGNGVNYKSGTNYFLQIGCVNDNQITATFQPSVVDSNTNEKIVDSSSEKPIILKLSFEKSLDKGEGTCLTYMTKVSVVE